MKINRTGYKGLNKYETIEGIQEIYKDCDGIWIYLKDGYVFEDDNTNSRSFENCGELKDEMKHVEIIKEEAEETEETTEENHITVNESEETAVYNAVESNEISMLDRNNKTAVLHDFDSIDWGLTYEECFNDGGYWILNEALILRKCNSLGEFIIGIAITQYEDGLFFEIIEACSDDVLGWDKTTLETVFDYCDGDSINGVKYSYDTDGINRCLNDFDRIIQTYEGGMFAWFNVKGIEID